jgi:hypothetical protein
LRSCCGMYRRKSNSDWEVPTSVWRTAVLAANHPPSFYELRDSDGAIRGTFRQPWIHSSLSSPAAGRWEQNW